MAAFDFDELKGDWRAYDIFRFGPITLFHKDDLLDGTIQYLESQNYFVPQIDCREADNGSDFYNAILFALGVLKAEYKDIQPIQFWDLVTEASFDNKTGIALAFRHFDAAYSRFPEHSQNALSVLAGYQYRWLWFGRRFTVLVQTSNPNLELEPVRQVEAHWNDRERSVKERMANE